MENQIITEKKFFTPLTIFSLILFVVVVGWNVYSYYFQKNFEVFTESMCDPELQNCFYRDCTLEECPPNGFEYYKKFSIQAYNLKQCDQNGDCGTFCEEKSTSCTEIPCDSSTDACSATE